jgi:hypothetical protein
MRKVMSRKRTVPPGETLGDSVMAPYLIPHIKENRAEIVDTLLAIWIRFRIKQADFYKRIWDWFHPRPAHDPRGTKIIAVVKGSKKYLEPEGKEES